MSKSDTDAFDMVLLGTLDPYGLYIRCRNNGPNKIAEKYIATNARYSYWYAEYVLKGKFGLGEEAIATDAELSYLYARNVLEGRFELGEKAIATDALSSCFYAKHVLDGRFELGEPIIKNSPLKEDYENYFNVKL